MFEWVDKKLVLAIHDRQLAEHGGSPGLRDGSLLESSLARPEQLFAYGDPEPDIADLTASLAYGIARNHPFIDGNKRTAFVAYMTFLALNDCTFDAGSEDRYLMMLALAEGNLKEKEFAAWLRLHIRSRSLSVQETPADYTVKPRRGRKKKA